MDSDRSGSLEFDEFVDLMLQTYKTKEQQTEDIRDAFMTFDTDGSGYITREVKSILLS